MIKAFLHRWYILRELNETYITHIPKKDNPTKVSDFRPVSLCNITYQFISKLLTNRLREVLPEIISPLQSAFIQDRDIYDNILITHEILSTFIYKRKRFEYMALKLDMEIAYDKIEWNFIFKCLYVGFSNIWIN